VGVAISTESFQAYRTPQKVFSAINADLGFFGLDAAADRDNALVLSYLDEAANALSPDTRWLSPTGYVWCNPPYKKILPWVLRAELAVDRKECERVVMLLPAQVSSKWFIRSVLRHEVQFFEGRICFDKPPGVENRRSPAIANCLVVIDRDGLRGVTAIRSAKTGVVLHDLTDLPKGASL
jgi:phage N-6-adenine-methyltransferase